MKSRFFHLGSKEIPFDSLPVFPLTGLDHVP